MGYMDEYKFWLESDCFDEKTKEELRSIADDDKEIQDRFYKNLKFGTGGMRGIMGAGTNRMNIYTVTKATQGLADYILEVGADAAGAVLGAAELLPAGAALRLCCGFPPGKLRSRDGPDVKNGAAHSLTTTGPSGGRRHIPAER